MRNPLLLVAFFFALLSSHASAQAAGPVPAPSHSSTPNNAVTAPTPHAIVGNWAWKLPGKACSETYDYSANGSRADSSGAEIIQGRYEISPLPSLLGFYRLLETVTTGNGKRDCSGDLHEASDAPVTRFIQFNPKRDQIIICKAESLAACFGPLKKVPG